MKRTLILGIVFLFPACRMFAQAPAQIPKPFSRVELLARRLAGQHQDHMERDVANRGARGYTDRSGQGQRALCSGGDLAEKR